MKHTIVSLLFLVSGIANAVTTVTVSNLDNVDTSDRAIVDNGGNVIALNAGVVAVGYFDSLVSPAQFSSTNRAALLTDFQQFGVSDTSGFQNPFNVDGFFSASFNGSIPKPSNGGVPSSFIGKTLCTVIGNASTLETSTDFIVFRHDGEEFEAETAGVGGNSGLVKPTDGTLLLGTDNGTITVSSSDVGSYRMAAIPVPEPSSMALLGLGGVVLLLRRRK